ncbi:MAG: LytTR family DNA-binding domain-containing protein [Draconibacterium sp.]|nr:LytTR family DNA-binding domain-containing protein [Draconibacterium sp.]
MDENNFKVLIVDDEPEARYLLRSLLSSIGNVKVVGEADNAENALYQLVEHYPNLIFMDINMPGKSGMELVKLIRKRNIDVSVVFISAFEEYAIEAIRCGVYDFLLKPVDQNELGKIICKYQRLNQKDLFAKVMEMLNSIKEEPKIRMNSKYSYILVNPNEIAYCASEEGCTNIYLTSGKIEFSNAPLTQIEAKVKNQNFCRLSRSVLINHDYIRTINKSANNCVLKHNGYEWKVEASRNSIRKLLGNSFNYA